MYNEIKSKLFAARFGGGEGGKITMATMKDVAEAAGVSIATVSRVLAGTVPVTDSTQQKVLAAMEELQYHGGVPSRTPGKKAASLVAVCVRDLSCPYDIDVLRGVEDVLSISGYIPLLFNADNDPDACRKLLQSLLPLRVAGALFIGCGSMLADAELPRSTAPLILLGEGSLSKGKLSTVVTVDLIRSGELAAQAFLQTGGSRFLCLAGRGGISGDPDPFCRSFSAALEAHGCQTAFLSLEHRRAWEQAAALLHAEEAPDCLFVQDVMTAAEVMRLLRREGKRVPEDVSVLCLENSASAKLTDPPLSVVAPAGYQVGMVGARCLIQYLEEDKPLPPTVTVAPRLVKRGSLKCM